MSKELELEQLRLELAPTWLVGAKDQPTVYAALLAPLLSIVKICSPYEGRP